MQLKDFTAAGDLAGKWRSGQGGHGRSARVLILVENAAVPFDRRVWPAAKALAARGYEVHVISPRTRSYPLRRESIDGVQIYRYRPGPEARSLIGYLPEYGIALLAQARIALWIRARKRIDVVQVCNPPDLLFLVALPLMALGARLVYDHHDVCPELVAAKCHNPSGWPVRLSRFLERLTYRACDLSLETNESFRRIALGRGQMSPCDVFVVRNAPERARFQDSRPDAKYRYGRKHMVGYVGIMEHQDGLDHLIDAADVIITRWHRTDVQFVLVGWGTEGPRLRERVLSAKLSDHVEFLGFITDERVIGSVLATADVCVCPDPLNAVNDVSSMHKVTEYMALGKPIAQFDLHENRVTAGDASLYAEPNDSEALARVIVALLDDPRMREEMGRIGLAKIATELSWEAQIPNLLAGYERVLSRRRDERHHSRPRQGSGR